AKKMSLPVFAVVGSSELNLDRVYDSGIDLILPIVNEPMSVESAMTSVRPLLFESGKKIIRILNFCDY
ncbi:MAG: glycerate kinase, partial [Eubacteriales bacterium]|nr:glycerate kinase [Eubacteriales bacterium]